MKTLTRLAAAAVLGLGLLVTSLPPGIALADGTLLTVTGKITNTNRGKLDPFADAVFDHLQVTFDSGLTFSEKDLEALPQSTVKASYPGWPHEVTLTGPLLSDILDKAGAKGEKVLVRAIDGYAPEFTAADVKAGKFILALEADGKRLDMGGRGPLWLAFAPKSYKDQAEDDSGLVFAVIQVEVQ